MTKYISGLVVVAVLALAGAAYWWATSPAAPSRTADHRNAVQATPAAESEEEEEEEMVAFEFPAEGPMKTYHMEHGGEAIITMYWPKKTWAHIEHFSSIVYPNEPTVLELEHPEPGLYPLTLDSGEIRGYVQVD